MSCVYRMSAEMATEAKPKATGKTESSPTKTSQPFKMLGVRDDRTLLALALNAQRGF